MSWDEDFALLNEVVDRARTDTGRVVIPDDLFRRIQQRVGKTPDEQSARP